MTSYLNLIRNFQRLHREKRFTPLQYLVYMELLSECNRLGWPESFYLKGGYMTDSIGVSRPTLSRIRRALRDRGLISYADGDGNGHTVYTILDTDAMADEIAESSRNSQIVSKGENIENSVEPSEPRPDRSIAGVNDNVDVDVTDNPRVDAPGNPLDNPNKDIEDKKKFKEKPSIEGKKKSQTQSKSKNSDTADDGKPDAKPQPDTRPQSDARPCLSPSQTLRKFRRETDSEAYASFLDWIAENAPYVSSNIYTLSEHEFEVLRHNFGSQSIVNNILNLENRKDLRKRYKSLYRTLLNWCRNGN